MDGHNPRMNETIPNDPAPEEPAERALALVRILGLDKDTFAVVDNLGFVLIAGIDEGDLRPGARMRTLCIEGDTLYWGQLQDLCHRVQGAIQDILESQRVDNTIKPLPAAVLEEDNPATGDAKLDAMLRELPQFRQLLQQCFGRERGAMRRRMLP